LIQKGSISEEDGTSFLRWRSGNHGPRVKNSLAVN
jgi:hypothetical protein